MINVEDCTNVKFTCRLEFDGPDGKHYDKIATPNNLSLSLCDIRDSIMGVINDFQQKE
jgi:hypothetical protein